MLNQLHLSAEKRLFCPVCTVITTLNNYGLHSFGKNHETPTFSGRAVKFKAKTVKKKVNFQF
jgi:hypothetical protein